MGLNNELSNLARQPNNIVGALQIRNLCILKIHTPADPPAFCSARLLFLFYCPAPTSHFYYAHKLLVREMKRTMGGTILMSSTSGNPVCTPVFRAKSIYCAINFGCRVPSSPFSGCFVMFWPQVNSFSFSFFSTGVFTSTLIIQTNSLTTIPTGKKYSQCHL